MTLLLEGTARSVLDGLRAAPVAALDDLAGEGAVLIVAPHADDETLGCGGLIDALRRRRTIVLIDILTDGARSHPNSSDYPADRLTALRRSEARLAAETLGLDADVIQFHDQPDGYLGRDPAQAAALVERLIARIDRAAATAVFVTSGADPHPDHKTAFHLTREAVRRSRAQPRLFAYPIWAWREACHLSLGTDAVAAHRLDISTSLRIKRDAVECYRSQLGRVVLDDPDGFSLSAGDLDLFIRTHEVFVEYARA